MDEAYAGDIIGVFDPGIFSIGDTVCVPGKKFAYEGIPTFAPEHFARVRLLDSMKSGDVQAELYETGAGLEHALNTSALKTYSADKIKKS